MDDQPVLSDRERAKKYRSLHKEKVKEANKIRMRQIRAREKAERAKDPKKKLEYNKNEALRKRKYRSKLNSTGSSESAPFTHSQKRGSYKSPQSFGKALKKTFRTLPKSPSKQIAVVSKLAIQAGLKLQPTDGKKTLKDKDLEDTVTNFYFRSDIVYTSPGMKDELTIWKNGKKLKLRKLYLTMFLREAYSLFKENHPEKLIAFSTFCKLRPSNVLLLHETPVDQCKCLTCENLFLKLGSLKVTYSSDFWNESLCDDAVNTLCWQGGCEDCSKGQNVAGNVDEETTVTWKEWAKKEGKLTCIINEGCAGQLLSGLQEKFASTARHINTKRIQAAEFHSDKESDTCRILQMDFAMNYSCEYQNEVQSALWSRGSVTLFTAAAMVHATCKTFLICSDTKEKEKNTVRAFIHQLYEELEPNSEENQELTEIIWTDGLSSEFKNRYMCQLLQELSDRYNKSFQWKYFATSHGKGVVDGVGGRAKSIVRNTVMSKKPNAPVVQSAEDFAELVRVLMPSTKVILIKDKDIPRSDKTWAKAAEVPGIKSMHIIMAKPKSELQLQLNAKTRENDQTRKTTAFTVVVGDWVVVQYDEERYPGEVVQVVGTEVEVSVMAKASTKYWKWPNKPDKLFYIKDNVIAKITPPEVANSRGLFLFKDIF